MKTITRKERMARQTKEREEKQRDTVLLLLSVGFLAGGILGYLIEGNLSGPTGLASFFQQAAQGAIVPSVWREVWAVFRWPLGVMVLSLLPLAGLTVPILFFLRGLFLSYGIVALMEGTGASGVLCAGIVFGPTCLLAVPALFLLGTAGLLQKAAEEPKKGAFFRRTVICLLMFACCVFLNQSVVPKGLGFLLQALGSAEG